MVKQRTEQGSTGGQFLTVEAAARKLGRSRLRVREAAARGLLPSRRDNQGRLRVDLPLDRGADCGVDLTPDAVVALLFDEIEELTHTLAAKDGEFEALSNLMLRQADALDRASQAVAGAEQTQARLSELLDRALSHLEAKTDETTRLGAISDRALTHLDATGDALAQTLAQSSRFGSLLDRALAAGERIGQENTELENRIGQQAETIETALSMSERAVELANRSKAPRRSLFRRLFRKK